MADPVLTLKYVMTVDDMRAQMARARKRSLHDWSRRGAALLMAWIASNSWRDGDYWFTGFLCLAAISIAFSRDLLFWSLFRWIEQRYGDSTMHIEIDDQGLLYRDSTQKYGNRFWWSRLTSYEEDDGDFKLSFDGNSGPGLHIPSRAFADEQQRTTFRSLVEQHLPEPTFSHLA